MTYEYGQSDKNKQWYWHLKASNGRKIAAGGEGYKNEKDCTDDIDRVKASKDAPVKKVKIA